jgi:hypothetical protein
VNTSYFANKTNVEGNAGITGNDTSPTYWDLQGWASRAASMACRMGRTRATGRRQIRLHIT